MNKTIVIGVFLGWVSLSYIGCSQAELNHPLNPSSDEYIGDEYAMDNDGNGVADIIDLYADECGNDLSCALINARSDSLIAPESSSTIILSSSQDPFSSSQDNSSSKGSSSSVTISSSSSLPPIPTFKVKLVNAVISGTSQTSGEFPANARIELVANGLSGLDICFDKWSASEGSISNEFNSEIVFRLPINPSGSDITIEANKLACPGHFTDARDGKKYKYVELGVDIWMATNLNYASGESTCYLDDELNCLKYGRLYDWATASGTGKNDSDEGNLAGTQGICPQGWHLPTRGQFDDLIAQDTLLSGGYGKYNGPSITFSSIDQYGRYWTSDIGESNVDNGTMRNFCDFKDSNPEKCATGFAHNVGGAEGWLYYAAEENKSNLFSVRCIQN